MQRTENDPIDLTAFLREKGVQHAEAVGHLLEDQSLSNTYLWSEPLLIDSAMEVLQDRGHTEDYELLGLHTNWETLLIEALDDDDELAASICLDYISDKSAADVPGNGAWDSLKGFFK